MVDNCKACKRIRDKDACFDGIGEKECKNLHDDKGIDGKGKNCSDLHDLNDCFVDTPIKKLPAYDDCDWKKWAKDSGWGIYNTLKGVICSICGLQDTVDKIKKEQYKLVACKEVGVGIFGGTSYSASYLEDQNGHRTLSNFQLRVQVFSKDTITIKKGTKMEIKFVGKGTNDKKLSCMNVVENLAPVVWHNYGYDRPDRTPEIFPQNNCYIGTSGRGPGRENFPANVYIIALDNDVTFNGGIPYQTSVFWSEEPIF